MNDQDSGRDGLFELATALNDGDFTPEQAGRLRELLTAHGNLLPVFVRTLLLQALLYRDAGGLHQGMAEAEAGTLRQVVAADEDRVSCEADGLALSAREAPPMLSRTVGDKTPGRSAVKWRSRLDRWSWATALAFVVVIVLYAGWRVMTVNRGNVLNQRPGIAGASGPKVPQERPGIAATSRANTEKERPSVASWTASDDCRLLTPKDGAAGGSLRPGQRLALASGSAKIRFDSGAEVKLSGSADIEINSANKCSLSIGQLSARAESLQSHGFTVVLRTAKIVDVGTGFDIVAWADGHSQVHVSEGAVEVHMANAQKVHRLQAGQDMEIEPGSPGVTARIESGNGTPAFKFPTIEPPSDQDYVDALQGHATLRVVQGSLDIKSGPVTVLNDGHAQHNADSPQESLFFAKETSGRILMDLGKAVSVSKVNTYSWQKNRAGQQYVLYGATGPAAPPTKGDLSACGWRLVARVNTDKDLGLPRDVDSPVQQGVSITAAGDPIGRYRYLLWELQPAPPEHKPVGDNVCYGEFDVYTGPEAGNPSIEITSVPTDPPNENLCLEAMHGTVSGGNNLEQKVVIYALGGNTWWVQPYDIMRDAKFGEDGKWETNTHGGTEFAALLVKSSYQPQAKLDALPEIGGDVLAMAKKKPEIGTKVWVADAAEAGKLVIVKAVYGGFDSGPSADVTEKVKGMVKDGRLSVEVNPANLGDPAPGIGKKLIVDYTFGGRARSKTVFDNQTLTISKTGE